MRTVLVTGYDGFLGRALTSRLVSRYRVYGVSRHASASSESIIALHGDILRPNLGIENLSGIETVFHLAGIVNLGSDKDGRVWQTNVEGTKNVVNFCIKNRVPRLVYCGTAFTTNRNPYERSKKMAELVVSEADIPKVTIFKPSIILGSPEQLSGQHFLQYVTLLIRVHRRAELIRRRIEGTLRLPVLAPVFRIRGNPEGLSNLVKVDDVADAMATIKDEGTYWLTNPHPPTLKQVLEWIGDFIMVKLEAHLDFSPTPLELAFGKMTRAFTPYLLGDKFHSDITASSITKEYIEESIKKLVSRE